MRRFLDLSLRRKLHVARALLVDPELPPLSRVLAAGIMIYLMIAFFPMPLPLRFMNRVWFAAAAVVAAAALVRIIPEDRLDAAIGDA
jgi:hypothetical protein